MKKYVYFVEESDSDKEAYGPYSTLEEAKHFEREFSDQVWRIYKSELPPYQNTVEV